LTPTAIPDGQFGIVDVSSNQTVVPANFAALPDEFRIISKLNGRVYYSFDTIVKSTMSNKLAKAYQTEQINKWIATITDCNCINGFQLIVNMDEQSLLQRDGLTWTHRDFVVDVAPEELLCLCSCDGKHPVYENNVITNALVNKVNSLNSAFYEAEASLDVSGLTTYADLAALNTAVPSPTQGDLAIITGTGTVMYDGSAWVTVATVAGIFSDLATFIAINKTVNTDAVTTNDGPNVQFILKGKVQPAGLYRDLEVNYVYPRGVALHPVIQLNGSTGITFTETQALRYEIGAGYDMRAEEFECMSLYSNLNFYPQLSDGIASPDLVYQFENSTNYNTVSFEFSSRKSGLEDVPEGHYKQFAVMLAASDSGVYTSLSAIFYTVRILAKI